MIEDILYSNKEFSRYYTDDKMEYWDDIVCNLNNVCHKCKDDLNICDACYQQFCNKCENIHDCDL
jgi:hypothetical protein